MKKRQPFRSTARRIKVLHVSLLLLTFAYPAVVDVPTGSGAGWAVAVGVYFLTGCLGITMTFHRGLTHAAFRFRWRWIENVCAYLGSMNCTGSPLGWALVHIDHHKYADTERDPHSPRKSVLFLANQTYDQIDADIHKVRSMVASKYHRFLHKWYFAVVIAHAVAVFLLAGPEWFWFLFPVPALLGVVASVLNNIFSHASGGYRNYETDDNSKNVWWVALLTWGEGWHNNHHAEPWMWSFSRHWREVDLTGLVLRALMACRLAAPGVKW